MHSLPRGVRNAQIKDSQAHKNLVADGLHPNYVEPADTQTQNYVEAMNAEA